MDVPSCSPTCSIEDRGSVAERLVGLAASCEGDLWGITGDEVVPIVESLFRNLEACSVAACSPSFVLEASAGDFGEAIAFYGGQLYHAAGSSVQVFERIDTSTNQIFDVGIDPGGPATSFDVASAMTAWPAQATLLLSGSNKLFRLSTAGVLSQVGTGTLDHFVNGLAFLDATCPSTTLFVDGFENGNTSSWSNGG